jgi:hypothetical protein
VTTPEKYPLPNMQDLSNGLHGSTIFSQSDLVKDYHQIPVATEDIPKTAIILPFGLFEYLFSPFGLVQRHTNISKNDGSHQRWPGRCVCIYGRLTCQFSRQANTPPPSGGFFHSFDRQWPRYHLEKCVFAAPSLEILGHTISATGAAPTADHAAEIENCPPPQDIKQLQCLLGMVNFYRRFSPKCAQILKPLTDLLKDGAKTLEWTVSAQEAFQNAKRLLAASVPLQHPAANAELPLATDASVRPKSRPPSHPDFHSFQNPGNGMCKFHAGFAPRRSCCN